MLGKKRDGCFFIPMQIHNALQQTCLNILKICMQSAYVSLLSLRCTIIGKELWCSCPVTSETSLNPSFDDRLMTCEQTAENITCCNIHKDNCPSPQVSFCPFSQEQTQDSPFSWLSPSIHNNSVGILSTPGALLFLGVLVTSLFFYKWLRCPENTLLGKILLSSFCNYIILAKSSIFVLYLTYALLMSLSQMLIPQENGLKLSYNVATSTAQSPFCDVLSSCWIICITRGLQEVTKSSPHIALLYSPSETFCFVHFMFFSHSFFWLQVFSSWCQIVPQWSSAFPPVHLVPSD